MATGTNFISGLSTGLDWEKIVNQIIAIEHKRIDLITNKKNEYSEKLSEWNSLNTKLLAFKNSLNNLKKSENFNLFKTTLATDNQNVKAPDLLTVSTSTNASIGSYTLKINSLATAQKLSSDTFSSIDTPFGNGYEGDIIVNGRVLNITPSDTLRSLCNKINSANSGENPIGVTASIISSNPGEYKLILTSDKTGSEGIKLANGGNLDILNKLGFTDTSRVAKNTISGGVLSDRFLSTTETFHLLLGLNNPQMAAEGEIVINGIPIGSLDLATDTLLSLETKLKNAGLRVSIISETEDSKTYYRLLIEGATFSFTDKNNILETLGFIRAGYSDVYGLIGDMGNTSKGSPITPNTLIKDIDGYIGFSPTDYIHLEGFDTDGNAVSDTLTISENTTIADLLDKIESTFGNVTASITYDGKLKIVDNTTGESPLSLKIYVRNQNGQIDETLKFDSDYDMGTATAVRKREITAGTDASITIDGINVSRKNNNIDDLIPGLTLNLLKADRNTNITINVTRDIDTILGYIRNFVDSYNSVSSYIRQQTSYNSTNNKAGGVLFGDGTLHRVKADLASILVQSISGVNKHLSSLGLIGVSVDRYGQLSIDENKLRSLLNSNFMDVMKVFAVSATTSSSMITYISHGTHTKPGTYDVYITKAATRSTSNPSDATELSGDETLTITSLGSVAVIELTQGMTMDQIVNAINSEVTDLGLTAYLDTKGHLVIRSNHYGSGHSFTIHQKNNLLWYSGDQVVDNGEDVEGTINGELATGTGQLLRGTAGKPNIDGLVIKYTGTQTGHVGTLTLTIGVAELFDRVLYNMTDSTNGYVTTKKQSLENSIKDYEDQINDMEKLLDKRKDQLLRDFQKMEAAIQKLKYQSDWLTGQLETIKKSWNL
ncbi:MAG: flagellar filament capping protein FliD [Syntrophales bacterium]|nr:flagellar filament capping protein FliD [Syntrophales bacterium]